VKNDDLSPEGSPAPLEYFSANEPQRARARGLNFWGAVLALGWVPYVCGVVNASTMLSSYSQRIIFAHAHGALLFMAAGLALSGASLVAFIVKRSAWGVVSAIGVIAVQVTIATCIGASAL
jgi:hypothetical protein